MKITIDSIEKMIVHHVGNKSNGEGVGFSEKNVNLEGIYRAQNEAYKGGDGEKRRKALPVKELCVMAASGRTKRNVYMGLHGV